MYLARVSLLNFRNFTEYSMDLQPGLNIILGENNTGKTNLLDAIRILISSGEERRDTWARLQDLHHDDEGNVAGDTFEIHLTFHDLSLEEWGLFNVCRVRAETGDVAQIHFRYKKYTSSRGRERGRPTIWGGEAEGTEVPREAMEEVRATFLPALRNAEADLRPGRNTRVSRLLAEVKESQDELDALVREVREANDAIQALDLIKRAEMIINRNLADVIGPVQRQSASFAMSEPQFREIADSIKVLVGRRKHFEVTENGLGYNNLLYISTVLGELSRSAGNDVSLPILMIDEPEAHLHPQLQMLLIEQLVSRVDPPVQILLTSHSPTLASKVPVERISVLHVGRTAERAGKIVVKPIRDCGLDVQQKRDLSRYLDITRSTLFFSRGVILVEGISEALLLPVLARKMGVDLSQFAVSVVNVSSLAFEPFAKLFQEGGLDIPCALITDADPAVGENEELSEDDQDQIIYPDHSVRPSATAAQLQGLASGQLQVFLASKTLEYDLALASESNALIMTRVYRDMGHPVIAKKIEESLAECATSRQRAKEFYKPSLGKYPREKGRFAQRLATYLDRVGISFTVPGYFHRAIYHVIDAQGVILVDRPCEALLLPALAQKIGVDLVEHHVTVINLGSLDLPLFSELLARGVLDMPCALIFSASPTVEEHEDLTEDEKDAILYPDRKNRVSATARRLLGFQSDRLRLFLACKAFEYDLALASDDNLLAMIQILKCVGPSEMCERIEEALAGCESIKGRAKAFYQHSFETYPLKVGDFTRQLADYLDTEETAFAVPAYICAAINHVTARRTGGQ